MVDAGGAANRGRGRAATVAVWLAIGVAVVLLGAFAVQMRASNADPQPGDMAPDFELETYDGDTIRLSDLRGSVVVLNFWASWCVPCAVEAPELEALWQDYADRGVVVLGIDYEDTRPAALAYLERHGVTYPNGLDRADTIARRYHLEGVPETFVVDPTGRIAALVPPGGGVPMAKIVGPVTETGSYAPTALRQRIDELLATADEAP